MLTDILGGPGAPKKTVPKTSAKRTKDKPKK